MTSVRLQAVEKTYDNGHKALVSLDLEIADGELLALIGPSGSGKSTLLRIVAGLESPSSGRVFLGERDVTQASPGERDVAMVFQSYALYPHMSVRENLGFGLRMRKVERAEIERRTLQLAERLSLIDVLDRKPSQLSGGQRQRVALGRALARKPQAFLLDEPLSNLDAKLRAEMRAEIGRLHAAFGVTTIYVTHDQEEAMTLGNRIAVLGLQGRIEQLAAPLEVYQRPASRFVAELVGMPRINWFEGELDHGEFIGGDLRVTVAMPVATDEHRAVLLGVRPHDLTLCSPERAKLRAHIELVEALGPTLLVHARRADGQDLRVLVPADAKVRRGDLVGALPSLDHLHLFDPVSGKRLNQKGDDPIRL